MKRHDRRLLHGIGAISLTALCLTAAAADDVGIKVKLNREEVFLGESLSMEVQLSGAIDAPEPDLSAITNASIRLVGSQPQSRSFTSIINGRVHSERFMGRIYYYDITPAAAGVFSAGPIVATVKGRRLTDPGTMIKVHGVEDQDVVKLRVEASRTSVMVDEPFTITLVVDIQALTGQFRQYAPLDPRNPPHLDADYLDTKEIQGLAMPDIQGALKSALIQGNAPGFTLNQYAYERSVMPFFAMGQAEAARFGFQSQTVSTNNHLYQEYRFPLTYTPKQEGSYTFGPVTFKGHALVSVKTSDRPLTRQFFAVGPAVVVRVMPPPEEGRPATFIGAVGSNLTVEASLDTQTCNVSDPLTLTLSIAGNANLDNLFPLDLAAVPDLARHFRVIEGVQTQTREKERLFIYTLRPTVAGTIELPPIPVSYYDVTSRSYRTARSQPLPVRVNETTRLTESRIFLLNSNADSALQGAKANIAVAPFDVHPIGAIPASPWFPRWVLITVVLAPLLFFLSLATRPALAAVSRLKTLGKKATALAQACSEIKAATPEKDDRAAAALVCRAVQRYCATRFGITAAENMTPAELKIALQQRGVDADHADKLASLLEKGVRVMFGGTTPSEQKGIAWREQVLSVLESVDRRRK